MPLYEEIVPAGRLVKLIVGGVIALLAILAFSPETSKTGLEVAVAWATMALAAGFFWNFRHIRITLTREEFRARYGLFNNKVIPVKDILSWEATTAPFRRYGGIGIRWGIDGSWAYTTSFGPAVRLKLRRGRPFVVSSSRPQELCHALDTVMGSSA